MCEANAYFEEEEGRQELFMEAVDIIEPQGEDRYLLVDIFGDRKIVDGKIKLMNLVAHRIVFAKKT
ncbi:MAG: CooT family nickel-binding protein [Desulfurivibrio sp.]|nr:CooT family nickel-binding protein [Desulfurivibrio sp.]